MWLLLLFFLLATLVQAYFWTGIFPRALAPDADRPTATGRPVSVIVCFRNEASRLADCIRGIQAQEYPDFELVLVDDNSTDASATIARRLAGTDPRIRVLQPGPTRPGKKDALSYGIDHARHDLLLLTDADCRPASREWITRMAAPLQARNGAELVLGVSPHRRVGGWLNRWQRYETTYTALQYLGLARAGLPYMGVGRNLAYRRSFFRRAGGLESHAHLAGGDDDLLVGGAARPGATAVVTAPTAWTVSAPSADWATYLRQKLRHHSVGTHYPRRFQGLLGGLALSHLTFYSLGVLLLCAGGWPVVVPAYGLRAYWLYAVFRNVRTRKFLGVRTTPPALLPGLLLGDALLNFYYPVVALGPLLPKRW